MSVKTHVMQQGVSVLTVEDRKSLLEALVQNYLSEQENNKVQQRENSDGYSIALGKLIGACMALNLELEETDKAINILTRNRKKMIVKLEK